MRCVKAALGSARGSPAAQRAARLRRAQKRRQLRPQRGDGVGAVADAILLRGVDLGEGAIAVQEHRVVAEAAAAARRVGDDGPRRRPRRSARAPSGRATTTTQRKRAVRRSAGTPRRRSSSRATLSASPRPAPASAAKRAERTPGTPPSASTSRPESSASAGRPLWRATACALSAGVGEEGVAVLGDRRQLGIVGQRAQRDRRVGEQRAQLAQLAGVAGGGDQDHAGAGARRGSARWRAPSSAIASLPSVGQAGRAARRVNGCASAVPCTSTKRRSPVMTRFMSTSARAVLVVAEVEQQLAADDADADRGDRVGAAGRR